VAVLSVVECRDNGLRHIVQCTGSGDFPRVRVGMGAPPPAWDLADWVLSKFQTEEERKIAFDAYMTAADAALCWAEMGIDQAMNRFNKRHAE
jgi:PTH1 family peptidyl-tRNA hydrolase